MLIELAIFVASLGVLVKGSNFMVKSAASIAKKLGVSSFIIGLTLVALGTSIPELASAIAASLNNVTNLVVGNVVGANIANIGLITGIAASVALIKTRKAMLERDGYIMLFVSVLFLVFALNGVIGFMESLAFVLIYVAYVFFLVESNSASEKAKAFRFKEFINYFFGFGYVLTLRSKLLGFRKGRKKKKLSSEQKKEVKGLFWAGILKDLLVVLASGCAIVFAAKFLVSEAMFFAEYLGISLTLIGVSIVSIGTTLPELAVSVSAARKGYGNIAIGNIIGSNIANIALIGGVAGLIIPLQVSLRAIFFIIPVMIAMAAALLIFIRSDWEIRRAEGIAFLVAYALFLVILFSF